MGEYGEPWKVVADRHDDAIFVRDAKGVYICETFDVGDGVTMDRIAACVNALDGVPDEELPMVATKIADCARLRALLGEAWAKLICFPLMTRNPKLSEEVNALTFRIAKELEVTK